MLGGGKCVYVGGTDLPVGLGPIPNAPQPG